MKISLCFLFLVLFKFNFLNSGVLLETPFKTKVDPCVQFFLGENSILSSPPAFLKEVPEKWRLYAWLERYRNIFSRYGRNLKLGKKPEIYSKADEPVVSIYHFDVPADLATTFNSGFSSSETDKFIFIEKNGKKYIRFFIADDPKLPVDRLFQKLQKMAKRQGIAITIKNKFKGIKFQGSCTYLIWDPKAPDKTIFFAKLPGGQKPLPPLQAKMAISNSTYIDEILSNAPSFFDYIKEETAPYFPSMDYVSIIRNEDPTKNKIDDDKFFFPLSGFLGSGLVKEIATIASLSEDEWIAKKYIPALAKYLAILHFRYGIYFEAHTQNLSIFIDKKTGEILAFTAKDMSDVLFDPFVLISQDKPVPIMKVKNENIMNLDFIDDPRAKEAGYHMALYDSQSFKSFTLPKQKNLHFLTKAFILHYVKEIKNETRLPIKLDPKTQKLMKELFSQHSYTKEENITDKIAAIFQDIYDQVTTMRSPKLADSTFKYEQKTLEDIYFRQIGKSRIAYPFKDSPSLENTALHEVNSKRFKFAYKNRVIYLYDTLKNKIISCAYNMSSSDLQKIWKSKQ